jgi:hypothetical protein
MAFPDSWRESICQYDGLSDGREWYDDTEEMAWNVVVRKKN